MGQAIRTTSGLIASASAASLQASITAVRTYLYAGAPVSVAVYNTIRAILASLLVHQHTAYDLYGNTLSSVTQTSGYPVSPAYNSSPLFVSSAQVDANIPPQILGAIVSASQVNQVLFLANLMTSHNHLITDLTN